MINFDTEKTYFFPDYYSEKLTDRELRQFRHEIELELAEYDLQTFGELDNYSNVEW